MIKEPITIKQLKIDLSKIINKKISRAWKGYGSALFLELGELHNELAWDNKGDATASLTGEWTLSSEGAWRFLSGNKIVLDAEKASSAEIKNLIKKFNGLTLKILEINEKLILHLSNNDVLEFNKAEYGFFTLISNEKKVISYENNLPYIHQATL